MKHVAELGEVPNEFAQDAKIIKALELVSKFPEQANTLRRGVVVNQRFKVLIDRFKGCEMPTRATRQVKALKDQVESLTKQNESLKDQVESLKEQVKCLQKLLQKSSSQT